MHPIPPANLDERTLDFWEHGSIRQILNVTFEAALLWELQQCGEGMRIGDDEERIMRDTIVPAVFMLLIDEIGWTTEEECAGCFTVSRQRRVQREMTKKVAEFLAGIRQENSGESGLVRPNFVCWTGADPV